MKLMYTGWGPVEGTHLRGEECVNVYVCVCEKERKREEEIEKKELDFANFAGCFT